MAEPRSVRLAVIGAGPGGYAAAFLAADLGMQVALIDSEPNPGGVCLYVGCIPSKALLHVAKVLDESRHAAHWGVKFAEPKVDLAKLRQWKNSVVGKMTGGLGQLSKARKVEYIQGRAAFEDSNTLRIEKQKGGEERLRADHIIIATGSQPARLPMFPRSKRVLDSTSALDLPRLPETMLVVGGGYIGLELGTVYAALGAKVSVVEMLPTLLAGADPDLVRPLAKRMESVFEAVLLETKVVEAKEQKDGIAITFEAKDGKRRQQTFDAVLVAVGRKPTSRIPGLEKTKVQTDGRGFIKVNQQRRTDDPAIYAIGDVAGEPMLAHKASHEGRTAVEAIAGRAVVFEPQAIPAVVFTDPEIAWCGLTEADAKKQGREVKVARFPWAASGRATTLDRNEGVTKLVIDPETERVLGVGICGPGAGELISEGVLAVEMGAVADDLRMTIHPHPTLSETVMESADVFFGQATHTYRPKRD